MKQKDLNALVARMTAGIKKYKFVLLIAAIGVVLLLLPSGKGDSTLVALEGIRICSQRSRAKRRM